jgi:hypothetical protein
MVVKTNLSTLWRKSLVSAWEAAEGRRVEKEKFEEETFGAEAQARNRNRNLEFMKTLLRS